MGYDVLLLPSKRTPAATRKPHHKYTNKSNKTQIWKTVRDMRRRKKSKE